MVACPECGSTNVEDLGDDMIECRDCWECFNETDADENDIAADPEDYY